MTNESIPTTSVLGRKLSAVYILTIAFLLAPRFATGQSYLTTIGTPPFASPSSVEMGSVNLANGNLRLVIPIASAPQRGGRPFSAALVYESRIWNVVIGSSKTWQPTNVPNSQGGWRFITTADPGSFTYQDATLSCWYTDPQGHQTQINYGFNNSNFQWAEPSGVIHTFAINTYQTNIVPCNSTSSNNTSGTAYAGDTSGYYMSITNYSTAVVYAPDGTQVYPSVKDSNGNYYSTDGNGNVIDTLGRTQVTKTVNGNTTYYDVLNSQGGTSRYTIVTSTVNVNTNFTQTGVTQYSGNFSAISSVGLPDGTSYSFTYDSGTTSGHFGLLTGMTLPSGGQITYGFTTFQDSIGNQNRWLHTRTSQTGTWSGTWTYSAVVPGSCTLNLGNCQQNITVTEPTGDYGLHNFILDTSGYGAWEWNHYVYNAQSALMMYTSTAWDINHGGLYEVPTSVHTTVPVPGSTWISRQVTYSYDTSGPLNERVSAVKEWKWYAGSSPSYPTTPDRETDTTYATTYSLITRLPASITVNGPSGMLAQTKITYDDPTRLTLKTGVVSHDDTNFGTSNTVRGNPTLVQNWVSGSTFISSSTYFDTTGQVTKTTDPNSNSVSYQYADSNFFSDNGANPPTTFTPSVTTNAFVTQVTLPITGSKSFGYYFNTGKPTFSRDQNGADFYNHYIDSLDRQTHAYGPSINGVRSWSLASYTSNTQSDIYRSNGDTTASVNCVNCVHAQHLRDGLRRPTTSKLVSDPEGAIKIDGAYDANGRVATKSNPYRSTSDPTYGTSQPSYDALNRAVGVTLADNNVRQAFYGDKVPASGLSSQLCSSSTYGLGYPVFSLDEAGNKVQNWKDGFGRLIEVDEPDPTSNTLNLSTCYSYDAANNLLQIVQGSQTRSFVYDGLSRMTSQILPESGTTTFSYTTSSGQLCAGNIQAICYKTDGRNVTTTYAYDALNRITSKTYSDSTPTATFYYDQTSFNGLTITNGAGRLTGMQETSGSNVLGKTAWTYDAAGRILTEQKTVGTITKSISYSYNIDGTLSFVTYPSGHKISYTYSNAGKAIAAVDTTSNINYALNAKFAPHGKLSTALYGQVQSGFAGITRTRTYNPRLQPTRITDSSPNGTIKDLSYSFDLGGGINNGNVAKITDNIVVGRSQLYTYDHLKRVSTANTQATSGSDCWGQNFTYDRYSNLTNIAVAQCSAPTLNQAVSTTTNHITTSGVTYDATGNLTNDGVQAYGWDAENRLKSAASVTYTYDGLGRRVQKTGGDSSTAMAWYDAHGNLLAETDASGNLTNEYIYFGGRRIARREASGTVLYYFNDRMQTNRAMTNSTGTVQQMSEYYPFGGEKVITGSLDDRFKFSGKRRDSETGLDQSAHRMYENTIGRWLAVDRGPMQLGNPQTLNRYAFVRNNPVNLYDPLGDYVTDPSEVYNPWYSFGYPTYSGDSGNVAGPSQGSDATGSDPGTGPPNLSAADLGAPSDPLSDPNLIAILNAPVAGPTCTDICVDTDFIVNGPYQEGGMLVNGYVPNNDGVVIGNSGVTIGGGVDLGQQTAQGLLSMGVSPSTVDALTPYLGLQGQDALNALNTQPLTLGAIATTQLTNLVLQSNINLAVSAFNNAAPNMNFQDLPPAYQTAVVDLYYNGPGTLQNSVFWGALTQGDFYNAYGGLTPGMYGTAGATWIGNRTGALQNYIYNQQGMPSGQPLPGPDVP